MPWWWGYTETVSPRPPRLHRISTTLGITRIEYNESALFFNETTQGQKLAKVCVG